MYENVTQKPIILYNSYMLTIVILKKRKKNSTKTLIEPNSMRKFDYRKCLSQAKHDGAHL